MTTNSEIVTREKARLFARWLGMGYAARYLASRGVTLTTARYWLLGVAP